MSACQSPAICTGASPPLGFDAIGAGVDQCCEDKADATQNELSSVMALDIGQNRNGQWAGNTGVLHRGEIDGKGPNDDETDRDRADDPFRSTGQLTGREDKQEPDNGQPRNHAEKPLTNSSHTACGVLGRQRSVCVSKADAPQSRQQGGDSDAVAGALEQNHETRRAPRTARSQATVGRLLQGRPQSPGEDAARGDDKCEREPHLPHDGSLTQTAADTGCMV